MRQREREREREREGGSRGKRMKERRMKTKEGEKTDSLSVKLRAKQNKTANLPARICQRFTFLSRRRESLTKGPKGRLVHVGIYVAETSGALSQPSMSAFRLRTDLKSKRIKSFVKLDA